MKKILLICLMIIFTVAAYGQLYEYHYWDYDYWEYVDSPEEMDQEDILFYNRLVKDYGDETEALRLVNLRRAHSNLLDSPATIVAYDFSNEGDSTKEYSSEIHMACIIFNTTVKTIKTITLTFTFFDKYHTQIYDVKTASPNFIIQFSNIKGRAKAWNEGTINQSVFIGGTEDCTYIKQFYNKNVSTSRLNSVKIVYTDGSVSKTCYVTDFSDALDNSPLRPALRFIQNHNNNGE